MGVEEEKLGQKKMNIGMKTNFIKLLKKECK